ncbi:MAG: twitching motility protein PilT [Micrococcales bacterium]|nr:twitching motility protein PilT [Micrococcales bacterium]
MRPSPRSILLDAQALTLLAQKAKLVHAWTTYAESVYARLYISSLTLTETTDGSPRDANVRRAVKLLITRPVTDDIALRAGALRASTTRRKPRDLTVGAVVAATALTLPSPVVVLTGDPDNLRLLLADTHVLVEPVG